jgi:mRNA-degrading endonuclease RelE of RelBE toxin-antitoxin system
MKAHNISIGILVLFALIIMHPWEVISAQHPQGPEGKGFLSGLTDEQREAIQDKVKELQNQNASPEEIKAEVDKMLKGYGVVLPEKPEGANKPMGFGPPGDLLDKLTGEQREAIQKKVKELQSQNASPEEVKVAVDKMLEGYGIEVPEKPDEFKEPIGFRAGGFFDKLTDEQRKAIQDKVKELQSQNASREEFRTAVDKMLEGYGIKPPGHRGPCDGKGFGPPFLSRLTDEQREAVMAKIKEMRDQGASREEIKAVVDGILEGYGVLSTENTENTVSKKTSAAETIEAWNYPNPFNPETEIAYNLPQDSRVRLTIYNIQGQRVKQLVDEYQNAGSRGVIWDGRDETGVKVASGIYFYRIEAGAHSVTNRMVFLK